MSSLRLVLLLAIAGALTLFVLQNWTPVLPLVILGVPTQAIPLAFWMMSAIAAGAVTTIVISALFRITAFTAAPRPSKQRGRSTRPPGVPPTGDRNFDPDIPYGVTDSPRTRIQTDDDWEAQPQEAWDDWDAPAATPPRETGRYRSVEDRPIVDFQMRDRQVDRVEREEYRFSTDRAEEPSVDRRDEQEEPEFYREPDREIGARPNFGNVEPPVYDADYRVYSPPYRPLDEPDEPPYTEPHEPEPNYRSDYFEPSRNEYPQPPYTEELDREVWDDWEEEPEPEAPYVPPEPQRPIVEVQQTPKSQYRSGTVYSYSYRNDEETSRDRTQDKAQDKTTDESTDRVIIPPAPAANDDEDWGFEDDDDPKRRSNDESW